MAVVVTNKAKKSGSTIYSGPDTGIAIVHVNLGYNPATGSPGTGKLLGFLP